MDEWRRNFGLQIHDARKATRLSRDAVAEKAGIGSKYLGQIERGEKWPTFETAIKIALAVGASPSVFLEKRASESNATDIRHDIARLLENRSTKQLNVVFRVVQALVSQPL